MRAQQFLSGVVVTPTAEFNDNPEYGLINVKDGIPYIWTSLSGTDTWFPLASRREVYVHTQGVAQQTWTITHGFGDVELIPIFFDINRNVFECSVQNVYNETTEEWELIATLGEPRTGWCTVFGATDISSPLMRAGTIEVLTSLTVAGQNVVTDANYTGAVIKTKLEAAGYNLDDFITVNDTIDLGSV